MDNHLELAAKRTLAKIIRSQETLKPLYLQPDRAIFLAKNSRVILKVYVEGNILQHEHAVAQKVQATGVPIPEILMIETAQLTVFAMKQVIGNPLSSRDTVAAKEAGSYIERFHTIRNYRPSSGDQTTWDDFVVRWTKHGIGSIEKLAIFTKSEVAALKKKFASINPMLMHRPAGSLIHSDLRAEHIIVDPQTQKVVAFLDFADARLGDPLLDLAVLSLWDKHRADVVLEGDTSIENNEQTKQLISYYRLLRHVVELPWLLDRNHKENAKKHITAIHDALEQ